ncbi:MAG: hypothetical protein HRU09_18545 [Oligoflexales bacterium]|nr:hypothetical protein [Oligoflexales bacterium]
MPKLIDQLSIKIPTSLAQESLVCNIYNSEDIEERVYEDFVPAIKVAN